MNILLLAPYPPFPPYGGGTMRIYQLTRGLAARHAVTCLTFAPDDDAEQALLPLHAICRVVTVRGPERRSLTWRAWTTATSPLPDMALRNQSAAYSAALVALLACEQFDVVQAESIEMAAYLTVVNSVQLKVNSQEAHAVKNSSLFTLHSSPTRVLDQFNAEFVLQQRAARTSLAALRRGRLTARNGAGALYSLAQWLKLARYERHVMRQCDLVLAVSDDDRRTLQELAGRATIGVVANGVDTSTFSRAALRAQHSGRFVFGPPTLVFTGTLDFRPNTDAVTWFVRQVLPHIQAVRPDVCLLIVGKRPSSAVRALASNTVIVTGEVPDARPYIASADVYVVPMRIGGGVRLKLLEALALETPVVSTAMGAEGIDGLRAGEHCLLSATPEAFADAVLRLLDDPALGARLGVAGRALVQAHYDWRTIIPRLEELYMRSAR